MDAVQIFRRRCLPQNKMPPIGHHHWVKDVAESVLRMLDQAPVGSAFDKMFEAATDPRQRIRLGSEFRASGPKL